MDRVAAIPGLDLHVAYLARSFAGAPWQAEPLRHAHSFPWRVPVGRAGELDLALHPGALARLLRFRPDVVVLSGWVDPTVLSLMASCRALRVPYVLGSESWRATGQAGVGRRVRDAVVRWAVTGARAWLPAGSRARDLLASWGADPARCHFYPTASDHARWGRLIDQARETAPRASLGLPDDGVITYVGRLVSVKAPDVALEAFARLLSRGVRCELVVVGDGPLRAQMERHPCWPRVRFLGFRQPAEVVRVLGATDVLVLASREETWGAAAGEALSGGIPVVLSDGVGSAPDLVGRDGPGEVVRAGDADALADALARLLARPDRRTELAALARRRALAWSHPLNLRSFLRALEDAGAPLSPEARALARAAIPSDPGAGAR